MATYNVVVATYLTITVEADDESEATAAAETAFNDHDWGSDIDPGRCNVQYTEKEDE